MSTIAAKYLVPDMRVNLAGALGWTKFGDSAYIGPADIVEAEGPDGLGDWVDVLCRPVGMVDTFEAKVYPEEMLEVMSWQA